MANYCKQCGTPIDDEHQICLKCKGEDDILFIFPDGIKKIRAGLEMAILMIDPENQPPQFTYQEARKIINEALDVINEPEYAKD